MKHYFSEDQMISSSLKAKHSPSSGNDSPTNPENKRKGLKKNEHQMVSRFEGDLFEEIQISPMKKTKVILQFLYNPEYLLQDSYIIINENNLKAFGRGNELFYDTISKLYSNKNDTKKQRKSSVPPQHIANLIGANEETKSNDDAYESP
jgi:hypothetical protein